MGMTLFVIACLVATIGLPLIPDLLDYLEARREQRRLFAWWRSPERAKMLEEHRASSERFERATYQRLPLR